MSRWIGSPAGSRSGTERTPGRRAAGFTLVEVLIAFVILALVLGALLPGFAAGLRGLDAADDYVAAALLAESRLDALGRAEPLTEGTTSGAFDNGFRWHLDVVPLDDLDQAGTLPVRAYEVVLTVSWDAGGDERSIVLETLRLGPVAERAGGPAPRPRGRP